MQDFEYFRGEESGQFAFFRMPKMLFSDPVFASVSLEAKVLYGLMLDRMELSRQNNWYDKSGKVYIIFTIAEMAGILNRSESKIYELLKELDSTEKGVGLIERKRQGLRIPNLIYVKKFYHSGFTPAPEEIQTSGNKKFQTSGNDEIQTSGNGEVWTSRKTRSGPPQKRGQDLQNMDTNNTDYNKTDDSKTDISKSRTGGKKYGTFGNVILSAQELKEMKRLWPDDWKYWINRLSEFMASSGKTYQNHYATICLWANREEKEAKKHSYEFPEGASL